MFVSSANRKKEKTLATSIRQAIDEDKKQQWAKNWTSRNITHDFPKA